MTIKVLQVLGKFQIGGAETLVMNIFKNIDREKIDFDFVVHGNEIGQYEKEVLKCGRKIYRVPKYKIYNHFEYIKAWDKIFKEHPEYEIIHCHVRSTASIILKISKKYGLKTISHSHGTTNGKGLSSIVKKLFQNSIHKYADYLLACSYDSAKWLYGKKLVSSSKCIILRNGVEVNKFSFSNNYRNEIRRKYNIEQDSFLVGNVGRLEDVKNQMFIVKLIPNIIKQNKNIRFMFCGDGSLLDTMREFITDNNLLDYVTFVKPNSEIFKYYSAFDLFVLPSKFEGLGMVLIEAQLSNLKCFTSSIISEEAIISDGVIKLPLENKFSWVSEILKESYKKSIRNINIKDALSSQYYISNTCKKIELLYKKITKKD